LRYSLNTQTENFQIVRSCRIPATVADLDGGRQTGDRLMQSVTHGHVS